MSRELKYLIIHFSATHEGREYSVDDVIGWHMNPPPAGNGWAKPGYSDLFHLDGSISNMTPFNTDNKVDPWEISFGAAGQNSHSRHICYIGGLREEVIDEHWEPADTRTDAQLYAMEVYVRYMILRHPNIKIAGHNQFSKKTCPGFSVPKWCRSIGIPEKNIYEK